MQPVEFKISAGLYHLTFMVIIGLNPYPWISGTMIERDLWKKFKTMLVTVQCYKPQKLTCFRKNANDTVVSSEIKFKPSVYWFIQL